MNDKWLRDLENLVAAADERITLHQADAYRLVNAAKDWVRLTKKKSLTRCSVCGLMWCQGPAKCPVCL